jgi:hypothetical protein
MYQLNRMQGGVKNLSERFTEDKSLLHLLRKLPRFLGRLVCSPVAILIRQFNSCILHKIRHVCHASDKVVLSNLQQSVKA